MTCSWLGCSRHYLPCRLHQPPTRTVSSQAGLLSLYTALYMGAKVHRCCSCCGSDRWWSKERLVKAMSQGHHSRSCSCLLIPAAWLSLSSLRQGPTKCTVSSARGLVALLSITGWLLSMFCLKCMSTLCSSSAALPSSAACTHSIHSTMEQWQA